MKNTEVVYLKERIIGDLLLLLAESRFSTDEDRKEIEDCVRVLRDTYIYGENATVSGRRAV